MALIFVASPAEAVQFGRPDDLQKEWQECRTAIGRLDGTLVDLRKYGFGLASGLLTAGGVLGGIANIIPKADSKPATESGSTAFVVSPSVVAVIVAVTVLLVIVLFVVDRYYSVIQWGAINRAKGLECALSLGMTMQISKWAGWRKPKLPILGWDLWLWRWVALIQYGGFVLVAFGLGTVVIGTQYLLWIAIVCASSLAVIGIIFAVADREYSALAIPPAFARDISLKTTTMPRPVTVKPGTDDYPVTLANAFPANTRALAVVLPFTNKDLFAVGCHIDEELVLQVGLRNATRGDIILAPGDVQVFTYISP